MQQALILDLNSGLLLATAAVLLVLGLLAATRRPAGFYTADRAVPALYSGMATSAALLSAAPFLGLAGTMFVLGSDGLAWLLGIAAGFVLMGLMIAPAFRASGAVTVPEFLALRFGGRAVPALAALIVFAICFAVLAAQLMAIGEVARFLTVPPLFAVGGACAVIAVIVAAGGSRGATWISILLLAGILAAYLAPLAMLTLAKHGTPAGPMAYGETLQQLQNIEIDMISEGLADARTLKPHLRPFLQVDYINTLALIVCLMAGTAALPHVLMRNAVTAGVRQTRMSMAWALLFTSAVLAAIPAYAALTKHELYSYIAKGVTFAELPEVFAQDGVAVHGVSFALYDTVAGLSQQGAGDVPGVDRAIRGTNGAQRSAWNDLKPQVKSALVEAAKGRGDSTLAERLATWRGTILPVAATAAGNKTGKLTQSGVSIEPASATFLGFRLAGLSPGWIVLFAVGAILAALATAIATAGAAAQCLGHDLRYARQTSPAVEIRATAGVRVASVLLAPAAGAAAVLGAADLGTAAWVFSVAAAGLFPVLVLGIWWKRTTRAGALAGMLAGLAVTLAYIGGSHFAPVPFYSATGAVSDAGPTAGKRLADLASVAEKASPDGKGPAEAALLTFARGTPYKAGAANWFGIHNSAAALFGLPLGFFIIILVSLLTRRPPAEALDFVRAIRRPSASLQAN